MKIIEMTTNTDRTGGLTIPAHILRESGVGAGESVRLAWMSKEGDGDKNTFREFFISTRGFDAALGDYEDEREIQIPSELLDAAGIPDECEVAITCVEGAIIISQEDSGGLADLLGEIYMTKGGAGDE